MPIYSALKAVNISLRFGIYSANRAPINFELAVGDRINVEGATIERGDRRYGASPEDLAEFRSLVTSGFLSEYSTGDMGVIKAAIVNALLNSTTAIKAATATQTTIQTFTAADLLAGGKAELLANPRNVQTSGNGNADITGGIITVVGTDINDNVITDTITIVASESGTKKSVKAFKTITSITIPAQGGASGTLAWGYASAFGVKEKIQPGAVAITTEFPTGTILTVPVTVDAVNNTITTVSTLDGTKDLTVVVGTPGEVVAS